MSIPHARMHRLSPALHLRRSIARTSILPLLLVSDSGALRLHTLAISYIKAIPTTIGKLLHLYYSIYHLHYTANAMADDSTRPHSGSIALTSIPTLETQSDWEDWIRSAEAWLISNDYDEPEPAPPSPVGVRTRTTGAAGATVAEYPLPSILAKWKRSQKKAITNLKSRCGKRAFGLVKDVQTIDDLFETLKDEFKPKGEGVFNEVYNRWENVNLGECKGVNDYCTQFDQIRTELTDLDPECIFPRAILVKKFLQGLGPAFQNWEMSFNQQHSIIGDNNTPGVTLLEAQGSAQVEEQRLKSNSTTIGMLSNANGKRPRYVNSNDPALTRWCRQCRHAGHWDHECWTQHPELRRIWEERNPEKAARRNARKRARTDDSASPPTTTSNAHGAMAIAVRTTNLF
jgi:hypothetical protein